MIRTQIQLEPSQFEVLRGEATKRNVSVAGLVREALAKYLNSPRKAALRNLSKLRPAFRPIPPEGISDHDRWYADAILESKRRTD